MKEIDEELILGVWEVIRNNITKTTVLKEAAQQFVTAFEKCGVDLNDYQIRGEDEYIDEAMGDPETQEEEIDYES